MADLSPVDLAAYDQQRQAASSTYGSGLAQLQYQRGVAGQNYGNTQYNLAHQYSLQRAALPGGYARRGLLNSGIYGNALSEADQSQSRALSQASLGYQQQLGGYGINEQNLGSTYTNALANIGAAESARRQELAAQLQGIM